MLVFLSGEREIHDTADALRRLDLRSTEVLPLYARLSSAEQHRIFERAPTGGPGRRIVLATNVAETSLTVPGRALRRRRRHRPHLALQPAPQGAAAADRTGLAGVGEPAGRVVAVASPPASASGCFAEDDFDARPEFTDPEILRTNLASVILQMTAIGLGDVAQFPFVEPPDHRVDPSTATPCSTNSLRSSLPRRREGRSASASRRSAATSPASRSTRGSGGWCSKRERLGCVREVLVIASALSIQDPRERPQDKREQAERVPQPLQGRRAPTCCRSSRCGTTCARSSASCRATSSGGCAARSTSTTCGCASGWTCSASSAGSPASWGSAPRPTTRHPDHVHQAVLAGLLSHIGMRDRETREFVGARQSRFVIAPGSALTRRPPPWVMAAELVETNQLYARRVAKIEPKWAEQAGRPSREALLRRTSGGIRRPGGPSPPSRSRSTACRSSATARSATTASTRRRPGRGSSRRRLIERDLADSAWIGRQQFLARNAEFLERIRRMAARVRRLELVDDEMLFDFYADRVGARRHLGPPLRPMVEGDPTAIGPTCSTSPTSSSPAAVGHGVRLADYPDVWRQRARRHRHRAAAHLPLRAGGAARRRRRCTCRCRA